jgi:hypothetical protein
MRSRGERARDDRDPVILDQRARGAEEGARSRRAVEHEQQRDRIEAARRSGERSEREIDLVGLDAAGAETPDHRARGLGRDHAIEERSDRRGDVAAAGADVEQRSTARVLAEQRAPRRGPEHVHRVGAEPSVGVVVAREAAERAMERARERTVRPCVLGDPALGLGVGWKLDLFRLGGIRLRRTADQADAHCSATRVPQVITESSASTIAIFSAWIRSSAATTPQPRTNPIAANGMNAALARKSAIPNGFACQAELTSSRIMCAKAVVSPHPGHGYPVKTRNPHGGRPSWVWVPWPSGLGVRSAAVISTAVGSAKSTAHVTREVQEPFSIPAPSAASAKGGRAGARSIAASSTGQA